MLKEFKDFALKGNLIDIAVGFVLGAAFATVITSLVEHIILPIVGIIFGEPSFDALLVTVNGSEIRYGSFITALVAFLLIALALFFFVVRPVNAIKARQKAEPDPDVPEPEEIVLLRQIAQNTGR